MGLTLAAVTAIVFLNSGVDLVASETAGATNTEVTWRWGWQGLLTVGKPALVTVSIPASRATTTGSPSSNNDTPSLQFEIVSTDAEGHRCRQLITATATTPVSAGRKEYAATFFAGRIDSPLIARLLIDGQEVASDILAGSTPRLLSRDRLFVSNVRLRGWDMLDEPGPGGVKQRGVILPAAEFPELAEAYRSVSTLIWAGAEGPRPAVSAALREWVQSGGRLVVSLPRNWSAWERSSWRAWLPVSITNDPFFVRDLSPLEFYAGRNTRIAVSGRLSVPRMTIASGKVVAASRDDALLVRVPCGLGEVRMLAIDLTEPPLSDWQGLPDLLGQLLEAKANADDKESPVAAGPGGQLSSTGITDLASQLTAIQEAIPGFEPRSPWLVMAWMMGLMAVLGPLDYLLVHRVLKRPTLTWLTMPTTLLVAALLAQWSAVMPVASATAVGPTNAAAAAAGSVGDQSASAGSASVATADVVTTQTDLVSIDVASATTHGQSWLTAFSTVPDRSAWRAALTTSLDRTATAERATPVGTTASDERPAPKSDDAAAQAGPQVPESAVVVWPWASPEATFGGLYRPAGTEWNRTEYEARPGLGRLEGVATLPGSTRVLSAEWKRSTAAQIEGQLQSPSVGRLAGTMTHTLPGPLVDWFVAYGNRAYRRQPDRATETSVPWSPGQPLALDDPQFFQRELRTVLTRSVMRRDQHATAGTTVRQEQTVFDRLERDPQRWGEVLTFHHAAGGTRYTGLTNQLLAEADLSRLLDLGQAVVYGVVEGASATTWERNGDPVQPVRRDLLVRIVLPVERSHQVLKTLPKFDAKPQ